MWTPANIESRSAVLDLSSSGQGNCAVRQVVCDDVIVCNASDHIDWSARSVQFELCDACLYAGCSSGGRVAIRRGDDHVLIIPDFAAMCQRQCDAMEYAPPRWMMKRGSLSFSRASWEVFRSAGGAPSFESIAPALTVELLQLYHFQAPREFLHDYLSPSLAQWELILSTSGHDSGNDLMHLRRLFSDASAFEGHEFCTPQAGSYTVSAFLDLVSVSEWPIFSSEADPAVRLSDDIYFRPKLRD
ncbi:hypothetical protein [Prosthecobacter sp.]|uniref:hypothetical protein n=1 Tax=Prosthecobacter sp. TaxID=1965333 RepID=UPI0037CA1E40